MKVLTKELEFKTKGHNDIINITDSVINFVEVSGMSEGTVTLFVVGSTAGLSTCEYEPALVSDIKEIFEKLVPRDVSYAHDDTWGDANGYAHVRATLLGSSLVVPVVKGRLTLGTWQQIILIDFDNRERQRKVVATFLGV